MLTKSNLKDLHTVVQRPAAEPRAVQIDAWLGDLYLGQRTYYNSTVKNALKNATNIIRQFGSLN